MNSNLLDDGGNIFIPVTIQFKKGKLASRKMWVILSILLYIFMVVFVAMVLIISDGPWVGKILVAVVVYLAVTLTIRFLFLNEGTIGKYYTQVLQRDYKMEAKDFWGIFSISNQYPYLCRFRNGTTGVFVRLERDVIVGKSRGWEFQHYKAVGDAYKRLWDTKIRATHIDIMSPVGVDDRLDYAYDSLLKCDNPDIRDVLTQMYTHIEESSQSSIATYEYYMFSTKGRDKDFIYNVRDVLDKFMKGNYLRYTFLTSADIRDLTEQLFNLESFSVAGAREEAFRGKGDSCVTPIRLVHPDGRQEILGKTKAEKRQESEFAKRRDELVKKERDKRAKSVKHQQPQTSSVIGGDEEIEW